MKDEKGSLSELSKISKISILIGENDEDCAEHAAMLNKILSEQEIKVDYVTMENTGHGFPENLKMYLEML